jgi:hypothetical protein
MKRAAVVALLAVLVAGCGAPSADLFVAKRTGSVPGAKLELLVSDGTARCNKGKPREISSQQVLEGRLIAKELETVTQRDIPPEKPAIFGFEVRSQSGTVHFADRNASPTVLPRIARLVRDIAIGVCGLPR